MTTFRLLLAELWHRRMNVVLSLVAPVVAATLFVAGPTLLDGYRRESDQRLTAMERQTAAALAAMRGKRTGNCWRCSRKPTRTWPNWSCEPCGSCAIWGSICALSTAIPI